MEIANLKTWRVISVFLLVLAFVSLSAQGGTYGGGDGTAANPYQIWTAEQMNTIGLHSEDWDKHFILMVDIDLGTYTGTEFNIIGRWSGYGDPCTIPFSGTFDGGGHTISNFTFVASPSRSATGLFGYVKGFYAEIKNLGLIGSQVDGGWLGGMIGSLVGRLERAKISCCFAEGGTISGRDDVAGLAGVSYYSSIKNCYSSADVSSTGKSGGLMGINSGVESLPGIIYNCYSTGKVTGRVVGGLVCLNKGTVLNSFWDVETSGQISSDGGIGKTTAEMMQKATFIEYGWDFTTPIWFIDEANDYPRLWLEKGNSAPVANAGADQVVYTCAGGMAQVKLDGSDSYDDDGDELEYFWFAGDEQIAAGVDPNVQLAIGEHLIELIVNDGTEDSQPDEVVITVAEALEVATKFTPQALNPGGGGKWVKAHIVLPEGFAVDDVDTSTPARIESLGIESEYLNVFINEDSLVEIEVAFKRGGFCAGSDFGPAEITVTGRLTSGQYFCGSDTIRIITNKLVYVADLASYWLQADCGPPDWCGGLDVDHNSTVDFVDFAMSDGCCIEVIEE